MNFKYSTRLIIIFRNIVIKIPVNRKGYLQGINENNIWIKYKNKAPLAELKWMFAGIVCQKRYDTIFKISDKQVKNIKALIPEFQFNNCDLYNYQNWGKDGNRFILLDYGINKYISTLYSNT